MKRLLNLPLQTSKMITAFSAYIKKLSLFKPGRKLLVAVSGGTDSMALCSLLLDAGYTFHVAHCNFSLRGKEADGDEKFVVEFCKKNSINCFHKKLDTRGYAEKEGLSIQMAARKLRYDWFDELMKEHTFDYLLTAHHANDNIETFFINLLRGSGVNGLKAILPKTKKIIRPLLFATRAEIEHYIAENKLAYREDSSNKEDKYLRNYLRLQIIPAFKKLNPSFEKTITEEIAVLQQTNLILQKEIEKQKKKLLLTDENSIKIAIEKLIKTTAAKLILFELIKVYGFNSSQANDIYDGLESQSGQVFTSNSHTLIKDRNFLIIKKTGDRTNEEYLIEEGVTKINHPVKIKIGFITGNINSIPKKAFTANKAFIDADKISFPLALTGWKLGDKFKPLGMKGFKKVSDFFINEKVSLFDKQNQWILRCGVDIVWLAGKRMDDRFKITEATKKICMMELYS
jgi:tRNA(Ile)-lysidine synthase